MAARGWTKQIRRKPLFEVINILQLLIQVISAIHNDFPIIS